MLGAQAREHFLIDGSIADAVDEGLDDFEVDVRLEQRHADLAQRHFHRFRREASLAPDGAENVLKAVAE